MTQVTIAARRRRGRVRGVAPGREEDAGAVLDEGDGEDEPGVLGDDVGDEEDDFAGLAGDNAVTGAATSSDALMR